MALADPGAFAFAIPQTQKSLGPGFRRDDEQIRNFPCRAWPRTRRICQRLAFQRIARKSLGPGFRRDDEQIRNFPCRACKHSAVMQPSATFAEPIFLMELP